MSSSSPPTSSAERVPAWAWWAAVIVAHGLPVFLVLNFVVRFAVDVPYWDQWELVPLLDKQAQGSLTWADVWARHNEHRVLLPRLCMLALAPLSRWDVRWEIALVVALVFASVLVAAWVHVRRAGLSAPALLAFAPVTWLMLSLRQEENLLWGWQLPLPLCAGSVLGVAALLGARAVTWRKVAAGVALATAASVSFGAGIALWPVGAVALAWRARDSAPRQVAGWIAAWLGSGALVGWSVLHGAALQPGQPSTLDALRQPTSVAWIALTAVGGAFGTGDTPALAALAGGVVLALGALVLWRAPQVDAGSGAFALVLCGVAWGASLLIGVSRTWLGPTAGLGSRYVSVSLLAVVGLWVLAWRLPSGRWRVGLLAALALLISEGTVVSLGTQFSQGAKLRRERAHAADVLRRYRSASDEELTVLYPAPAIVRDRAGTLERLGYSVFRTRANP